MWHNIFFYRNWTTKRTSNLLIFLKTEPSFAYIFFSLRAVVFPPPHLSPLYLADWNTIFARLEETRMLYYFKVNSPIANSLLKGKEPHASFLVRPASWSFWAADITTNSPFSHSLIPLYGALCSSPGATRRQRLWLALPATYCFPCFHHCRVLRLSPMDDLAAPIVSADFPTVSGPCARLLIVVLLAQPQGQRPWASWQGCLCHFF